MYLRYVGTYYISIKINDQKHNIFFFFIALNNINKTYLKAEKTLFLQLM